MKLFGKKNKKPIENIQLSTRHVALRWVALAVCLVIAIVSIGYAINALFSVNAGWMEIEDISTEITCADDFVLNYNFGDGGAEATAAYRRIAALYSDAAEQAYWMFTKDQAHETIVGVRTINDRVNEALTVDPVLYEAFALVEQYGNRSIYLAPLYAEHDSMLVSEFDQHAKDRDPAYNAEAAAYAEQIATFAKDPQMVQVELLDENQVMLRVSEEYLAFAQEHEIDTFVDFHWMKNAFIIDHFADLLIENGYTEGTISSEDGYIRNLDDSGSSYLFNIYDRPGDVAYLAAAMEYRQSASIVSLRAFPVSQDDAIERYYVYDDGSAVSPHMDAQDGVRKNATPTLVTHAHELGCAEVLLNAAPIYIADALDEGALRSLAAKGVHSVWCEENRIRYSDESLRFVNLYKDEQTQYTAVLAE